MLVVTGGRGELRDVFGRHFASVRVVGGGLIYATETSRLTSMKAPHRRQVISVLEREGMLRRSCGSGASVVVVGRRHRRLPSSYRPCVLGRVGFRSAMRATTIDERQPR